MALIGDVLRAIAQMTDRRFIGVFGISIALTLALLIGLAALVGWFVGYLPDTFSLPWIGEVTTPETGLQGIAVIGVLALSIFLMIPVSVIFVNLFLERIVRAVEARHYPEVGPVRDIGILEGVWSATLFFFVVIAANILGLIVALAVAPLAPFVFYIVNGYLIGREYFQTVAERYMPRAEARALRKRHGTRVFLAGVLMAIPLTVPLLNLVIPVLGVATFTHQVNRLRGVPRTGN